MGATIGRRHSDWVYGLAVNEDINEGKSLNKYQLQVFLRRFRRDPKSPAPPPFSTPEEVVGVRSDMSEETAASRYVKLSKEQDAPAEEIRPGELNQPVDVPQV